MQEEHSQQKTENGIIDYYIYRKEKNNHSFTSTEVQALLSELMHRKHMIVRNIFYSYLDYWGYEKCRSTKRKSDIEEICIDPFKTNGYFADGERKYVFKYRSDKEMVMIIACPKDTDISSLDDGFDIE